MVNFSIVLLKIIYMFLVYIGVTFKIMPSLHFSVKMKIKCDFMVKQFIVDLLMMTIDLLT